MSIFIGLLFTVSYLQHDAYLPFYKQTETVLHNCCGKLIRKESHVAKEQSQFAVISNVQVQIIYGQQTVMTSSRSGVLGYMASLMLGLAKSWVSLYTSPIVTPVILTLTIFNVLKSMVVHLSIFILIAGLRPERWQPVTLRLFVFMVKCLRTKH